MTANELRQKFLEFFQSKGHKVIPSAPLVPANDSTVLFTTAGMHPLVPFLLGEEHHAGRRLASCQKCIRTGDIEQVGDDVHLTFFEMLGNWSLGDYWKEEAIMMSFEFLTKELGLDINKLAVSCFAGDSDSPRDEESAMIWQELGILKNRIYFLGKEDNWWGPAGLTGPCGPDTEMFYWTGNEPVPAVFDPADKRWFEIWNNVFMQYNKTAEGKYEPLKQKNVDTGMGLERTLVALNGLSSVYETDLFTPLMNYLRNQVKGQAAERKFRVTADHIKAACFMVADGVVPSNKDRGYVVRRLLRRAMVYGRLLSLKPQWLKALAKQVITIYSGVYPELVEHSEQIFNVTAVEEEKFGRALENGIKELKKAFNIAIMGVDPENLPSGMVIKDNVLKTSGKYVFDIYQNYGLPLELSQEIMTSWGMKFDEATMMEARKQFDISFKRHQELSRTASAGTFKGGLADNTDEVVRLHTATHLMNAALRQVLGDHVWQKGSNITAERTRFDFTHPEKMTDQQKQAVEKLVNSWIERNLTVKKEIMPLVEAKKLEAIGVFGEKYTETVSVYTVLDSKTGEIISREFCGGPHVEHTGVIGKFKILKEEAVAAGIRRIKAAVS